MKSTNRLIEGDDGLPAEEVGVWTIEKHRFLKRYLDISRATRQKFLGDGNAGATYIDLFCSTGRARIRETGAWIDGSAVSAWKIGKEGRASFSEILVADIDQIRRKACVQRLQRIGAPVRELTGSAVEAARETIASINQYGLHFAFLDPYNLGELDFSIIQTLLELKRIDMLVHVSAMDLQRNLDRNVSSVDGAFDRFAPGWRGVGDLESSQSEIRRVVFDYWRNQIAKLGARTAPDVKLITGEKNQRLYWLLLATKHQLARKFWTVAANVHKQGELFF